VEDMGTVQSPKTRQWVDAVIEWAEDAMIETPADEAELANIGEGEFRKQWYTHWAKIEQDKLEMLSPTHSAVMPLRMGPVLVRAIQYDRSTCGWRRYRSKWEVGLER